MLSLIELDKLITLWFNSFHHSVLDTPVLIATGKFTWIPLYASIVFLLYKYYNRKSIWAIALIVITVVICESFTQVSKNTFQRLRPCNDPSLHNLIYVVQDACKQSYSFFSAHASNSFGIAVVISGLLKKHIKWITPLIFMWALLHSYTRVYLGVHFMGDIVVGGILGSIIGYLCLYSYHRWALPLIK